MTLLEEGRIPHHKVGLGSSVRIRDTATGEAVSYEIVTPEESDPAQGKISPSSPIGKCLLNHEEGDVVEVKVPSGTREYEILRLITIYDQEPSPVPPTA